jgi:hypothetical protein
MTAAISLGGAERFGAEAFGAAQAGAVARQTAHIPSMRMLGLRDILKGNAVIQFSCRCVRRDALAKTNRLTM